MSLLAPAALAELAAPGCCGSSMERPPKLAVDLSQRRSQRFLIVGAPWSCAENLRYLTQGVLSHNRALIVCSQVEVSLLLQQPNIQRLRSKLPHDREGEAQQVEQDADGSPTNCTRPADKANQDRNGSSKPSYILCALNLGGDALQQRCSMHLRHAAVRDEQC
eukprot:CAMPEP_0178370492 /NCGR_PEP_ID=MMETSP0689_2-20121128/331_1 /TAXON_ID=160604 /ORGANISM="Amphidinium massartii, Strain CS-259" /LENGTH=162 /DNA_ID=CAMNT_0019990317 /DNA_START=8 /DNA_END=496 /DNA_ORIENTATION=-